MAPLATVSPLSPSLISLVPARSVPLGMGGCVGGAGGAVVQNGFADRNSASKVWIQSMVIDGAEIGNEIADAAVFQTGAQVWTYSTWEKLMRESSYRVTRSRSNFLQGSELRLY